MPRALRTDAAEQDLDDIAYHIAVHESRPQTAYRMIDELIAKCDRCARNPFIGTAKPELGAGHRAFVYKRWVVIYRPIDDGIEVLRIVDGARDYGRLF